jgi:2-methylisocitrate lyase-like PEP mutase family enzyme
VGSARLLERLGFAALATTSSGFALSLGRLDYGVSRDDALAHCRALASAVEVPVSADLENGFGPEPDHAADTVARAARTGLAGGSIEDSTGDPAHPVFELPRAVERVHAAAEAARAAPGGFVLTARAEQLLYGDRDLDAVIRRLQAFSEAGADVLFAPGLRDFESVRTLCASLDKPVSVLAYGALRSLPLDALGQAGAARVSVGGALAYAAYAQLVSFAGVRDGEPFDTASLTAEQLKRMRDLLA